MNMLSASYQSGHNYSQQSIRWLEYEKLRRQAETGKEVQIEHALNVGERKIDKYWVDGFTPATDDTPATVYEFLGVSFTTQLI